MRYQRLLIFILSAYLFQQSLCHPNTISLKQENTIPVYNAHYASQLGCTPLFCSELNKTANPDNYAFWFTANTQTLFTTYCVDMIQDSRYKKEPYCDYDLILKFWIISSVALLYNKGNQYPKNDSRSSNHLNLATQSSLIKDSEEKNRADIEIDEAIALEQLNGQAARIYQIAQKIKTAQRLTPLQKLTKKRIVSRL